MSDLRRWSRSSGGLLGDGVAVSAGQREEGRLEGRHDRPELADRDAGAHEPHDQVVQGRLGTAYDERVVHPGRRVAAGHRAEGRRTGGDAAGALGVRGEESVVELAALRGQLAQRAREDDPARRQQRDLVAQRRQVVHPVAREDDGGAGVGQVGEHPVHLPLAGGVETVGRLVKHQQPRLPEEGGRQPETLPHPEGEAPDGISRHLAEADPVEQLVDVGAVRLAAEGGECREVLPRRQGRVETGAVHEPRDTAGHGERAPSRRPEDLQGAAVGDRQAEQEAEERGLPRTVGPDEAVDLSGGDIEVDAVEGDDVAERPGDTARPNRSGRLHGVLPSGRQAVALDNFPNGKLGAPDDLTRSVCRTAGEREPPPRGVGALDEKAGGPRPGLEMQRTAGSRVAACGSVLRARRDSNPKPSEAEIGGWGASELGLETAADLQ